MSKDPAFLFYSQDFYGGTRTMLPEERACYLDLMIYQHQNGYIPLDLKRVLMFCSGVDKATLEATLEAKFKRCDKGWYNEKLKKVVSERENYTKKQSENGIVGVFWRKANKVLNKKDQKKLKESISRACSNNTDLVNNWNTYLSDPKAMLNALLKHLEDEDEIEIEDINEIKKEIINPFETENFKSNWKVWKNYKKQEFNFSYKSDISEQGALKKLSELSGGNEDIAVKIIHQSISEGWKGFFKLKNNEQQPSNTKQGATDEFRRKTAERLGIVQS